MPVNARLAARRRAAASGCGPSFQISGDRFEELSVAVALNKVEVLKTQLHHDTRERRCRRLKDRLCECKAFLERR